MITPPAPILAIVGATASGKSDLALDVAERLGSEIVSCDSMSVYRGMDIGTAKPTLGQGRAVRHHLVDVAEPSEPFSVASYQGLASVAIAGIRARGARPLLVGGTGLYFRAVVDRLEFPTTDPRVRVELQTESVAGSERLFERLAELDPTAAAKIEPGNVRRTVRALEVAAVTGRLFSSFAEAWDSYPPDNVRAAGIAIGREALNERIERRVRRMVEDGFAEEVRGLLERGYGGWLTSSQAIGYAEFADHLAGRTTLEEAIVGTVRRTRALARRQMAWFKRDPRIRWFGVDHEDGPVGDEIVEYLRDG